MTFIWKCPQCGAQNTKTNGCGLCPYEPDLYEALCIHGFAYDMACDECPRSGFRFEGINNGEPDSTSPAYSQPLGWGDGRGSLSLPPSDEPYYPPDLIEDQLADEGSLDGPGFRCERMKGKTLTEAEWRTSHYKHGDAASDFEKVYNEIQPPGYKLYRLVCACGAFLQCMEELEGGD